MSETSAVPAVRRISPAYQQVADQLRGLILSGELEPGARLPNENELSSMFGVSRSTVREALRVLASQSLITTLRGVGGGSFIALPVPEDITTFLEASLGLLSGSDVVTVAELLEARELLEVPAARLAAQRRTEETLAELRASVDQERAATDATRQFEEHRRFHQAILLSAGNGLLQIMTAPIFTVLRNRFLREAAGDAFWSEVSHDHGDILDAIAAGDGDAAATRMHEHLERLRSTYERIDRDAAPGSAGGA